ncbi:MAG: patatin-like phospholipase family protein, partial [Gemmatimonadaceae bacterium]|nr:patatin-like phospholipase family protein [Gemmatimonadaceae bacterium]
GAHARLGAQAPGTTTAAAACAPARTALVLAGGGAKGLTHIGVLQALDSLGIVPDLIVGTSMGAIVGALYAGGDDGATVLARLRAVGLDELVRNYEPTVSASLGALEPILVWEEEPTHWVLQTGAVREMEVSAALSRLALRANVTARGDFDRLPIPFRAVATDLDSRQVVPIGGGDLARALRASMSIPLLLRPVVLEGRTLVDGGLSSNVPVGVARALGAERVIVSTIASPKPDPAAFDDPLTVSTQLFEFLWVQDPLDARPGDVVIAQPTAAYGMLDFRPVMLDSLARVGRRTAVAALTQAACVRPLATGRSRPYPPVAVGRVRIGPPGVQGLDLVQRELTLAARGALDAQAVSEGLARLASQERYRGIWLGPSGAAERPDFDVQVEAAPTRSFGIGVAFDQTMSGRVWLAAADRAFTGRDLEMSALLTAGVYRSDLTVAVRRRARIGGRYLPVGGALTAATENVRLWQGATELPSVGIREAALAIGLRPLYDPGWSYELGADVRFWEGRSVVRRGTAGVRYAVRYRERGSPAPTFSVDAVGLREWQRLSADLARTFRVGRADVRPRLRAGWGRRLPLHQTFTLGGLDGFAGLRMLEQRGDHELFGSLLVRWPLWRQLHGRFEPMVGVTGQGGYFQGPGALDGTVLAGARVGVDLDTPFGPIRIEQGVNNQDRRQALIRFGTWF